jgi:hypothetical protein
MNLETLRDRFPRCAIVVIGDCDRDAGALLVLREFGARVYAVGLARAERKRELLRAGVDVSGIVRSRTQVLGAALDRLGVADAIVFLPGEWNPEREEVLEQERELAAADGRSLRPLLSLDDPRYDFARSAAQLAVFALARAAGADFDPAKEFSNRYSSGHTDKNPRRRSRGRGSRPPAG